MPSSIPMFDEKFLGTIKEIQPNKVFDVGVGSGKTGRLIKTVIPDCKIEGCEVHNDYLVTYSKTHESYFNIYPESVMSVIQTLDEKYDLVVFGDVLEHLFFSQVYDVLDFFQYRSKFMILIIPLSSYQGSWEGHLHERHVSDIKLNDISSRYNVLEYVKKTENKYTKCYYFLKGNL